MGSTIWPPPKAPEGSSHHQDLPSNLHMARPDTPSPCQSAASHGDDQSSRVERQASHEKMDMNADHKGGKLRSYQDSEEKGEISDGEESLSRKQDGSTHTGDSRTCFFSRLCWSVTGNHCVWIITISWLTLRWPPFWFIALSCHVSGISITFAYCLRFIIYGNHSLPNIAYCL